MLKMENVSNWRSFISLLMYSMDCNQVEFAKRIGVTQSAVSSWLCGRSKPNEEHRRLIARYVK